MASDELSERKAKQAANLIKARAAAKAKRDQRAANLEAAPPELRPTRPTVEVRTDDIEQSAFEAAVAARVAAEVEARFATFEQKLKEIGSRDSSTGVTKAAEDQLKPVLEHLGMAFASLSAQGVGVQKPVAPEVLEARERAHARMVELIREARFEGKTPTYRLRAPVYLDEVFVVEKWTDTDHVEQPTDIEWPGAPNLAMVPLNDTAKAIHAAFKDSIGNMGRLTKTEELAEFSRGLKVKTGLKAKERLQPEVSPFDASYEGLRIKHKLARGQSRLTHVLGTIAEPAEISG